MAKVLSRDSMDFAAYEAATENLQKVRKAGDFFDGVRAEFERRDSGKRYPGMSSTKAGALLQFAPGEVTAWAGYNGHKKSMFTSQVALDLCQAGERVLLASMEMTPAKTLARMARQAAAHNRPSDAWLAGFQGWTNNRLWLFDHLGRVTPKQTVGLVRYFASELKGTHIVIDSMMMIVGSEESLDEQKDFVTDLVAVAQECSCHIHLVTHCRKPASGDEGKPPTKYDIRGAAAITDQCANVVLVWWNKAKQAALERDSMNLEEQKKPDAMVIVDKQRNDGWEGKLQFWFDQRALRFCDSRTAETEPYDIGGEL
jgi:twinkle protein